MPDDWLVHLVRLSVFSTEMISPTESYWTGATGETEAENRTSGMGGKQYSGRRHGGIVQLNFAGNRLDVLLAIDPEAARAGVLPTVAPVSEVSPPFAAICRRLLSHLEFPVGRLAFGGTYLLPAASREASYESVGSLITSLKVDPVRARDLLYRVNWPVESAAVPGLSLNRLTTLSTIAFGQMMLHGNAGQMTMLPTAPDSFVYATSLEIDHNTPAERGGSFENDQLIPIFDELLELTSENLTSGEIQ